MRATLTMSVPIPKIIAASTTVLFACLDHQALHLAHGFMQATEYGPRDYRMTDIQFANIAQRGNRLNIVVVQAMPCINLHP